MDKKPFKLSPKSGDNKKRGLKNAGFVALVILTGLIIFAAYGQPSTLKDVSFSEVVKSANAGEVQKISIEGNDLEITKKGESKPTEKSRKEPKTNIYKKKITNRNVEIDVKSNSNTK